MNKKTREEIPKQVQSAMIQVAKQMPLKNIWCLKPEQIFFILDIDFHPVRQKSISSSLLIGMDSAWPGFCYLFKINTQILMAASNPSETASKILRGALASPMVTVLTGIFFREASSAFTGREPAAMTTVSAGIRS